jgi:SAM-dependent methyltransferase
MVSEDMWDYLNTKRWDARLLPIAGYLATKLEGKFVLDLDCGYGRLLQYIYPPIFGEYIGNDIVKEFVDGLTLRYPYCRFYNKGDDWVARKFVGRVDVLLVLGYGPAFSGAESTTIDGSIKKLLSADKKPEIVIIEHSPHPKIDGSLAFLLDWILFHGYKKEFEFTVDVGADDWKGIRHILILEVER